MKYEENVPLVKLLHARTLRPEVDGREYEVWLEWFGDGGFANPGYWRAYEIGFPVGGTHPFLAQDDNPGTCVVKAAHALHDRHKKKLAEQEAKAKQKSRADLDALEQELTDFRRYVLGDLDKLQAKLKAIRE